MTGHGTYAAAMHMQSLEAYPFDSILVPYNYTMMQQPQYAHDFDALYDMCQARGVAMQTIKGIAARRWQDGDEEKRFSWYRYYRCRCHEARYRFCAEPGKFIHQY